jgi:hypothetical protein
MAFVREDQNRQVFNSLDQALEFIHSLDPKVNQEVKILLNLAGAYIVRWE